MGSDPTPSKHGGGETAPQRVRRRRPPSPEEQARRVAWGRKYGPIMKELRKQWPN